MLKTAKRTIRKWFRNARKPHWSPSSPDVDTIEKVRARHPSFDGLTEEIRAAGTDSLSHFGNNYTHEGGLCLQQNPHEFAALCLALSESEPIRTYLEIGTASGGTCLFLYQRLHFERTFCMDDGGHPRAPLQDEHLARIPNCTRFIGDSHSTEARRFLDDALPDTIDVAFIDGDHTYDGVWEDIRLVHDYCRTGTLMLFHDIVACDGVQRAWHEAAEANFMAHQAEFVGKERPLGIGIARAQCSN